MPKMTAKYSAAHYIAQGLGLATGDQETLYAQLQERGYFWNSTTKKWEFSDPAEADPPTPLVMLRVWADSEKLDAITNDLAHLIRTYLGWVPVKRNGPYQCRPPKQGESRMYLEYLPEDE